MKNSSFYTMIASDLLLVEKELLTVIQTPEDMLTQIGAHLTKAGGKRLRPALYLLCARLSKAPLVDPIAVAAAIELIHMATLVHDDVIDNAATRRGIPTANVVWGNHPSVLAGDFLFAKAFSLVAAQGNSQIVSVLADVICSMCEGEIVQIKECFNSHQTEADYYARIAKKTADFIVGSIQCGAVTAGLSSGDIEALRIYGKGIGLAFQITDDILDFTASSKQLGKPAANDLRQGIITLPAIHAMMHSSHGQQLRDMIARRDMTDADIEQGLAIVHDAGSIEYAYSQVDRCLDEARRAVPASIDEITRRALWEVADLIGQRSY